jgi:hypothetical protein
MRTMVLPLFLFCPWPFVGRWPFANGR